MRLFIFCIGSSRAIISEESPEIFFLNISYEADFAFTHTTSTYERKTWKEWGIYKSSISIL